MTKVVGSEYNEKELKSTRKPVELYRLWKQSGGADWRYTSADVPILYNGNVYVPATLKRSSVSYSADLEITSMQITAADVMEPVSEYVSSNPVDVLWVEVLKIFRDQDTVQANTIFIGQVLRVSLKGRGAAIKCVGFEYFLNTEIPTKRISPACQNTLYDTYCGLDKSSYRISTTVAKSDNFTFSSADFALQSDDYYSRGEFIWEGHKRMITSQKSNVITIRYPIVDIPISATIVAYAGCDQKISTCRDRYANVANFFGHPYVPIDNPATRL